MPIAKPAAPLRLHRFALSGHCHRVELFLNLLGLPFETIDVDLKGGAHKRPEFLALHPFGQVPLLEDGATAIYDSNAILVYLATKYDDGTWLPREPLAAARVQQWLSLAAGPIAGGPGAARAAALFGSPTDVERATRRAHALFGVLETEFGKRRYAIGEQPCIADLAGYSYIARAPEGGIALDAYPNLRAWLARVEALPGFVPMPESRLPNAA
jgi:glutathione S-transferase